VAASKAFGITFVKSPKKRERRFLELVDPVSRAAWDTYINFFRHFCHARTSEQAIAAATEFVDQYPHMSDDLAAFKQALTEQH